MLAVVAIAARVVDEADAPASTSTSILGVGEGQLQRGLGAQTGLCRCGCGLGRRDVVNVRLVFAFGSQEPRCAAEDDGDYEPDDRCPTVLY